MKNSIDINQLRDDIQQAWDDQGLLRNNELKEKYEQFYTPWIIATYMASFLKCNKNKSIRFLDPGAGMGSLTIAFVYNVLLWKIKPKDLTVVLYEIDETVDPYLKTVMLKLAALCSQHEINLHWEIKYCNFIIEGINEIKKSNYEQFDYVILNPPYKKLKSDSVENKLLLQIGINAANYYASFVSISKRLLKHNGELVAITPRSFCNGVYFTPFRSDLTFGMRFSNIHLFESRTSIFSSDTDKILQEVIIYHCIKDDWDDEKSVTVSYSTDYTFNDLTIRKLKLKQIIYPTDKNKIVRIVKNDDDNIISAQIESLPCKHSDLEIDISTGPIVDFREKVMK